MTPACVLIVGPANWVYFSEMVTGLASVAAVIAIIVIKYFVHLWLYILNIH